MSATPSGTTPPAWRVALSEPTLGEEEAQAAAEVIRSGWLTQGARVQAFERAFAELVGVPHAIAVSNCTVGLELMYEAAGVGPGDEVIVPALTFVATANAARRFGAVPVFADVRAPDDLCLDPADVARKITARTRAICAMHYGGYAADMAALARVAAGANVALLEDCAHAPGARGEGGAACGAMGEIGAFSFFSNKNLTCGEGGMLTTRSDALAARLRLTRAHGMTSSTWDRHRGHAFSYDVAAVGTNARLDEVRAAVGLVQLGRLAAGNRARAARVARYRANLAGRAPGLILPFADRDPGASAHHLFVVLLPEGTDRARVMTALRERGVQSSIHYPPTHRFSAYAPARGEPAVSLPVTDAVAPRLLTLPLFATMTDAQVDEVCAALLDALAA